MLAPVYFDTHTVKLLLNRALFFRGAYTAELVKGWLKLKPAPDKRGRGAAGNIVPFKQQC